MTLTFALGLLQIILHWAARATLLQVTSIQSGPVWNTPGSRLGRCSLAVLLSLTHVRLFEIPWIAACQAPLSFLFPHLAQIHVQGVPLALCKELQCDFFFVCLTASPTGWQIPYRQWRPIISVQCFSDILSFWKTSNASPLLIKIKTPYPGIQGYWTCLHNLIILSIIIYSLLIHLVVNC